MFILAIDPGNKLSAFVVLDEKKKIHDKGKVSNLELLKLVKDLRRVGALPKIEHMAIEMIASMGMAVGKEVFETVFWIGRFVQAWGVRHTRVFRQEVKLHLCGQARAKDKNIRIALIDLLGPQGSKRSPGPTYGVSADIWSALAVGVTWLDTKWNPK